MYQLPKIALLGIIMLSFNCDSDPLKVVFDFPKELKEVSAVEVTSKSELVWTILDSGNDTELYAFDGNGHLVRTINIEDAKNHDWEDLASDKHGNLYIGDFGNNHNMRTNLRIYKVNATDLNKTSASSASKIDFYFPEQKAFPPLDAEKYYDLEAFFVWNDNFYLFTKNRSSEFDGTTMLYTIPNQPGNHAARLLATYKTCGDFRNCSITSADISSDGKTVALLSYSHAWIFTNYKNQQFFDGEVRQIDFSNFSQKEGICFAGDTKLFVTDERKKKNGGRLYELQLPKSKSKS